MRPFSPLYYIRENKKRCILLMFMIFLSYGVYLGGLYVSNPLDNWQLAFAYYDEMTTVIPASEDGDYTEFQAFAQELRETGKVEVLELGEYSGLRWESIMGFELGIVAHTFRTVEDFKLYCEYMGIECDFAKLKDGSLIMSEQFAQNRGLEIGDTINRGYDMNVYDTYTLDAVTAEKGYTQYYIKEEVDSDGWIMLLPKGISGREMYQLAYEVCEKHPVSIYDSLKRDIEGQMEAFNMIYMFVVALISIILAVTINAAFVGMYQRRNLEFAVYRAIGIRKHALFGKLVGELLWMDVIALAVGGIVFFLGLYLCNQLILYPVGKYLRYFDPLALFGIVLCNVVVLVPLVSTRCRQLVKADICEY